MFPLEIDFFEETMLHLWTQHQICQRGAFIMTRAEGVSAYTQPRNGKGIGLKG